jgi:hypothetical protein
LSSVLWLDGETNSTSCIGADAESFGRGSGTGIGIGIVMVKSDLLFPKVLRRTFDILHGQCSVQRFEMTGISD